LNTHHLHRATGEYSSPPFGGGNIREARLQEKAFWILIAENNLKFGGIPSRPEDDSDKITPVISCLLKRFRRIDAKRWVHVIHAMGGLTNCNNYFSATDTPNLPQVAETNTTCLTDAAKKCLLYD
jgi:hypothetical protein